MWINKKMEVFDLENKEQKTTSTMKMDIDFGGRQC